MAIRPPSSRKPCNDGVVAGGRRPAFALVAFALVALAVVVAGCGSGSHSRPRATEKHARADGNLWVSNLGGSCARQATPGPEVMGQECGSLNQAYEAASCGDVVDIDAGTYSAVQALNDNPSLDACSSPVVFQAAPDVPRSAVVFSAAGNSIDDYDGAFGAGKGASNWVLRNVTVKADIALDGVHGVTIDGIDGGSFYVAGSSDITVKNSDLGPCYNLISLPAGQKNDNGTPGPTYSPDPTIKCNDNIKIAGGTNITFRHNVIHDFLDDNSTGATDHFECVFIAAGTGVTFDGNRFYHCQIYAIFLQDFAGPISGVTIENNWFSEGQGGMGACTSDRSGCPPESSGGSDHDTLTFGASNTGISDVLIRYNSFDPCCGLSQEGSAMGANIRAVGNILGGPTAGGCITGVNFSYNLWQHGAGGPCGTGDATIPTNPFLSAGNPDATQDDLHLKCGTTARNFVTPNAADYRLAYDIDGKPRNPNGPRDAGASAERSCGP